MTELKLMIECGSTTCYSKPGKHCRFLGSRKFGQIPMCMLFPSRSGLSSTELFENSDGWVARCEDCLEASGGVSDVHRDAFDAAVKRADRLEKEVARLKDELDRLEHTVNLLRGWELHPNGCWIIPKHAVHHPALAISRTLSSLSSQLEKTGLLVPEVDEKDATVEQVVRRKIELVKSNVTRSGHACLAMICGMKFLDVVEEIGDNGNFLSESRILSFIKAHGLVCRYVSFIRIGIGAPPNTAGVRGKLALIAKVMLAGEHPWWVLVHDGLVYDPTSKAPSLSYPGRITSYLPVWLWSDVEKSEDSSS